MNCSYLTKSDKRFHSNWFNLTEDDQHTSNRCHSNKQTSLDVGSSACDRFFDINESIDVGAVGVVQSHLTGEVQCVADS